MDKTYAQMVKLHRKYRDQGFEILAFPCNQFVGKMSNEKIKRFTRVTHGAEFPLFSLVDINGPKTCEVYKFLRLNSPLYDQTKGTVNEIPWNFTKFLVNCKGEVVSYHNPYADTQELEPEIEKILNEYE